MQEGEADHERRCHHISSSGISSSFLLLCYFGNVKQISTAHDIFVSAGLSVWSYRAGQQGIHTAQRDSIGRTRERARHSHDDQGRGSHVYDKDRFLAMMQLAMSKLDRWQVSSLGRYIMEL